MIGNTTAASWGAPTVTPVVLPDVWSDLESLGYITHVDNIASILEHGILSYNAAQSHDHTSVADTEVQERRESPILDTGLTVHDHANVYINPRNAMLYRLTRRKPLKELAVIRVGASRVMGMQGALVSDQNAATGGVHYYPAPAGLLKLDRASVFTNRWVVNGVRYLQTMKRMMAEVLVPGAIPSSYMTSIVAPTAGAAVTLRTRFPSRKIVVDGELFFQ